MGHISKSCDPAAILLPYHTGSIPVITSSISRIFLLRVLKAQVYRIGTADGSMRALSRFKEISKGIPVRNAFSIIEIAQLSISHNLNDVAEKFIGKVKLSGFFVVND
jgi:hypothetical protein